MNIDDFLSAGKRDSAPASRTAAAALLVSRIEIERSRAVFVDRKVSPGKTVTLAIDDLTGRATDIGPTTAARFELAARFLADSGRNLTLKGTIGPPPTEGPVGEAPLAAALSGKGLALARLAPYVEAFQSSDPGTFSIDGKVAGKLLGALELSGNVARNVAKLRPRFGTTRQSQPQPSTRAAHSSTVARPASSRTPTSSVNGTSIWRSRSQIASNSSA